MQEDTKGRKKKRRRKSRFGYYLYAITVLLLTIVNITLAALLLTQVQEVHVSGTKYSQKSEVISWVREDPLTINSLYTLWKFKFGHYILPKNLQSVDVSLKAPWSVQVNVQEKQIVGCVLVGNSYVCFDGEGLVLQKGSEYNPDIPLIEGIDVKEATLLENLKVENEKVFSYIVNVTEQIRGEKLCPDRIVWGDNSMNLFFEGICVQLGKSNYEEKIPELSPILDELKGKIGTLHMEHYSKDSKSISFEKSDEES